MSVEELALSHYKSRGFVNGNYNIIIQYRFNYSILGF